MARNDRKDIRKNASIIISEDHYNALGVARSLGKAKFPIFLLVESGTKSFVGKSKYIKDTFFLESIYSKIIDIVKEISIDYDSVFLFPLSDKSACFVDENYKIFPTNCISPNMNGEMAKYQNKYFLKQYAVSMGLDVPNGKVLDLKENHLDFSWNVYPAIIKPLVSAEGKKTDIKTVFDKSSLIETINTFINEGYERVLIEEYICGNNEHMVEVMGYCSKGKAITCGIVSKIREFPFNNGSTSYAQLVNEHIGIDCFRISKFIENSGFSGLFDMEFKYANEKCYFIECNFRNGAPGYALTIFGKNIPLEWINALAEETVLYKCRKPLSKEKKFMCEQNDILNMLKGDVSLFKWLWQYMTCKKIFFALSDIRPCLNYYKDFIKYHFTKKRI